MNILQRKKVFSVLFSAINFIIKIKILTILLLENEILKLRAVEPDDLEMLYIWENDPQLWLVGNTRQPLSKFALKQYIIDTHKDIYESRQLRLMIVEKKNNQTIGTVDLYDLPSMIKISPAKYSTGPSPYKFILLPMVSRFMFP